MTAPLRWPAESLWEAVAPRLPGFTVEILHEIDSSNTELMRRARAGQTDPVLLVAERQTAGRGRRGRTWVSHPGDSLTFSLGLSLAPADWSGLSLAVGVAVAQALDPRIGLKWPNDLWIGGRKLAGILVETASAVAAGHPVAGGVMRRHAVIGIGINIAPCVPGPGMDIVPAGLRELWPQADAPAVLARVVPSLVDALQAFEREGFAPFAAGFAARDVLAGRDVTLSDGTSGRACGVDRGGALLVHTAAGLQPVSSHEVSVRPAP